MGASSDESASRRSYLIFPESVIEICAALCAAYISPLFIGPFLIRDRFMLKGPPVERGMAITDQPKAPKWCEMPVPISRMSSYASSIGVRISVSTRP